MGIGTASPAQKLEVSGSGTQRVRLTESGTGNYFQFAVATSGTALTAFGTGTDNIQFVTGVSERMRIDSSGNVGIGTSNPSSPLSVVNTSATQLFLGRKDTNVNSNAAVGRVAFGTSNGTGGAEYAGAEITCVSAQTWTDGSAQGSHLAFSSAAVGSATLTEKMRITSSGNVGIGDSSPAYKTTVVGTTSLAVDTEGLLSDATTTTVGCTAGGQSLNLRGASSGNIKFSIGSTEHMRIASTGNVGIGTDSPSDELAVLGTISVQDSSSATDALKISANTASSYQNTITHGDIGLEFDNNSASRGYVWSVNGSQKVLIDSSGNLLVGTTSNPTGPAKIVTEANSSNNYGIVIKSTNGTGNNLVYARFTNSSDVQAGQIIQTGSTTVNYATSSDERLKENIVDAPAGNIDALQVRSFDWKADGAHQTYGFVAQELESAAPYAVSKGETEDDMWAVDYSKLVPMLVKEIQDLKAKVEALKNA